MEKATNREMEYLRRIHTLEHELGIEKSNAIFARERRDSAEKKIGLLESEHQSHIKKLQAEMVELKNEISQLKRGKTASIESSKKYQRVARALVVMADMRDALERQIMDQRKAFQDQNNAQRRAMEDGKAEIKKQLQANIDEALLPSARKEYYSRFLKNIDLKNLMALHQNMKFFDDRS